MAPRQYLFGTVLVPNILYFAILHRANPDFGCTVPMLILHRANNIIVAVKKLSKTFLEKAKMRAVGNVCVLDKKVCVHTFTQVIWGGEVYIYET